VPETKDKTLEQIEHSFTQGSLPVRLTFSQEEPRKEWVIVRESLISRQDGLLGCRERPLRQTRIVATVDCMNGRRYESGCTELLETTALPIVRAGNAGGLELN
jgi:hypothetical protein